MPLPLRNVKWQLKDPLRETKKTHSSPHEDKSERPICSRRFGGLS